ncbi:hypothetical protein, partial [Vibrio parahaemolyticus]|uniref:hypothetical protein n=1 Tax=Vibrio parahaemolyticus TaxID=670 RepID=UPI00117264BD
SIQEGQSTRGEFGLNLGIRVYGGKLKLGGCALLPLNAALVANEEIAAKTECLGLIVRVLCSILHFELRDLGSRN